MKVLMIDRCYMCFYSRAIRWYWRHDDDVVCVARAESARASGRFQTCWHSEGKGVEEIAPKDPIPDWCPLPDAPEGESHE